MSAQLQGLAFHGVPLTADFELDEAAMLAAIAQHKPSIVYLAYPNNPTGNLWSDDTIEKIVLGEIAEAARPEGRSIGRVSRMTDAVDRYVAHAVSSMGGVRLDGMRVALDNAHGASSFTSAAALEQLGADVQVFHSEPDGFNINEECGCTHSEELERLVRQSQAQAGIAHDGDADRIALFELFTKSAGDLLDSWFESDPIKALFGFDGVQHQLHRGVGEV